MKTFFTKKDRLFLCLLLSLATTGLLSAQNCANDTSPKTVNIRFGNVSISPNNSKIYFSIDLQSAEPVGPNSDFCTSSWSIRFTYNHALFGNPQVGTPVPVLTEEAHKISEQVGPFGNIITSYGLLTFGPIARLNPSSWTSVGAVELDILDPSTFNFLTTPVEFTFEEDTSVTPTVGQQYIIITSQPSLLFNYFVNYSNGVILPVDLLSFTANYKSPQDLIELNWVTLKENNNQYFEIKRSSNNKDWQTLTTIQSQGDATTKQGYQWQDKKP